MQTLNLLLCVILFATCTLGQPSLSCEFTGTSGQDIRGIVTLTQQESKIQLGGFIFAKEPILTPGQHGFHVHAAGDISSASSTGGHFNPFDVSHGCGTQRHAGDIGNITVRYQNGYLIADASLLNTTIVSVNNLVGLALVLHEKPDDCSGDTGNAGGRLAHCVLGIKKSSNLVTHYVGRDVSKATCFFQPSTSQSFLAKAVLIQGDELTLSGNISSNPFTGNISVHIVEHGEMSQTDMSDCLTPIYEYSNAADKNHSFSVPLKGRTLHSNMDTCLVGKQLCLVNDGKIIAQCVVGVKESSGAFPTTTSTTGQHSHDDDNNSFSKAGTILGIVLAVFVLLGLSAYTFLQRRRRAQRGFQRVVNSS